MNKTKVLVVCGATATGKTGLAVMLGKRFGGELISADSRQVYKFMDIGTGKDLDSGQIDRRSSLLTTGLSEEIDIGFKKKDGIPVWLIDMVLPSYRMNVGEYRTAALRVFEDIIKRRKLPILVGGTGLYIKSIVENLDLITIPPDEKLRNKLSKMDKYKLRELLKKEDPEKFVSLNSSDINNPRRLIRAIEIAEFRKKRGKITFPYRKDYDYLLIGLKCDRQDLSVLIRERIKRRMEQGMIEEIKMLLGKKFTFQSPGFSSIGYPLFQNYIEDEYRLTPAQKEKMLADIIDLWLKNEMSYAKRQLVWFNKQRNIHWFNLMSKDYVKEIFELVGKWYTS